MGYPRKTLAAIAAALAAGGLGGYLITALATASLTVGSGGTAIDKLLIGSYTINVDSMGAGQATSSPQTLTGASTGDTCEVTVSAGDYESTTSTGRVRCRITATNTATLYFWNSTPTSAFDAGASTFKVLSISP